LQRKGHNRRQERKKTPAANWTNRKASTEMDLRGGKRSGRKRADGSKVVVTNMRGEKFWDKMRGKERKRKQIDYQLKKAVSQSPHAVKVPVFKGRKEDRVRRKRGAFENRN